MAAATSLPLVFALNGVRVELPEVDPSLTLLTYLRTQTPLRGTKRGCGEGGCGACVVFVSRYDPRTKHIGERTVNSCLALLCSFDGCAITTTEGLGSQRSDHHVIHKRMAGFHASQCGFCTPGMTMALYGTLRKSLTKPGCRATSLTAAEAERSIAGNICRCTGYRPLLDACKSFCPDADVEDLGLHHFPEQDGRLPPYDSSRDPVFPQFLIEECEARDSRHNGAHGAHGAHVSASMNGSKGGVQPRFRHSDNVGATEREKVWIDAKSSADVREALKTYQKTETEVKLVVGNTAAGYYKDINPTVYIDISKVPELLVLNETADGIQVGASVTISNFTEFLENLENDPRESANGGVGVKPTVAHVLAAHLRKIASSHVRNWGSMGGNLMMARLYNFESDIATIMLGVGAQVTVSTGGGAEKIQLEDFLGKPGALGTGEFLQSIWIPRESSGVIFKTFRAAPRPSGFALAYLNAAFRAQVSESDRGGVTLGAVRLAFGAFGTDHAIRARGVENHLNGKLLTWEVISEAVRLLKTELVPKPGTPKAAYRVSVAVSFLFQFLAPFLQSGWDFGSKFDGLLSSGKQTIPLTDQFFPVGHPAAKTAAELQASGEAVYVDDIPAPADCLHAALVLSEKALAKIDRVDALAALQTPGTVAFISNADIPAKGQNIGVSVGSLSKQKLFATDLVECVGHLLGVMVADTYDHAKEAARRVKVQYDTASVGPPVLSAKEAVERKSLFPVHPFVAGKYQPIDDIAEGFAAGALKLEDVQVTTESQKHFYMETQAALAIPDEDNCMVVYCSTQGPDYVQRAVAEALGLPYHNVRVITRRVGGGFGGKVFRGSSVAVACALAAYKLRRPVRTSLDRNTDMIYIGGRSPTTSTFSVAFTEDGRITALKTQILIEAGYEADFSCFLPGDFTHAFKKYNFGALEIDYKICKTNTVPKTAMRGPGQVQGSFLAESVIEAVAARVGLDPEVVRERNFHDISSLTKYFGEGTVGKPEGYTLPSMWDRLKASAQWAARAEQVHKFNATSTWVKRGLAMIPIVYSNANTSKTAMVSIFADGSIAVETAGVELGQGLHTKVRQAATFALSKLFPKGQELDMSRFRIVQLDTISSVSSGITSGSTTSEGCCQAVKEACQVLVERLTPVYKTMEAASPDGRVQWENLVARASFTTDLKVHHRYTPKQFVYLNYAAAASEVEIDLLTGEVQILATDLVFDCGKSLNPAVDIGQIEGAFVQGIGFYVTERVETEDGRELADGTWGYKVPTVDTIQKRFHIELFNSPTLQDRVLSSKASGEAPLLLAGSVHSAIRKAILAARTDSAQWRANAITLSETGSRSEAFNLGEFRLDPPATIDRIKKLCGLDNVELYLAARASAGNGKNNTNEGPP